MRAVFLALALSCVSPAATYYVEAIGGNDRSSGQSPETPWKSLARLAAANVVPGDRILLACGSVWREQLKLTWSGADGSPILVDRYGTGARPRIDAAGTATDAVLIRNASFIEVRNLEVTNRGDGAAVRRGVHIFLEDYGTAHGIVVSGLYVHDVNGTNEVKDSGGIIFRTHGGKKPSRFNGLRLERNVVRAVDRSGIAAESSHWPRTKWFPSLNVVIRDNFVDDIGGDGIVPWATDGVLVEHNIVRDCNRRAKSYNAGIWPWSTDNSRFRLNEASFTRTQLDGQGFDSDYNSRNTVFEYNYSHDNEGGFMLICSPGKRDPKENLGNIGTIVRRNISRNDGARIFHISAAENSTVEDNAIYVGPGLDVQMLIATDWSGWANGALFRRNRFYSIGTSRYGHDAGRDELGRYKLEAGWGPAQGIVFEGNQYYGTHVDPPADTTGVFKKDVPRIDRDWAGPRFDATDVESYPAFLNKHRAWIENLMRQEFGRIEPL